MNSAAANRVETVLRDELARDDRALSGVVPVLGYVLAGSGHSLINDAVVARVRGMLNHLASQLVARFEGHVADPLAVDGAAVDAFAQLLANDAPMLAYIHALATEGLLTERLEKRAAIDPVLSPLWQELIASQDAATGETAMQALMAQSRFIQSQRRMQQPVLELPAEILERALRIWARWAPVEQEPAVTQALRILKEEYDEAQTRLGLIARLLAPLRGGVVAALELEHAGFALFSSALAQRTGQGRESAVLACYDHQSARLAVSLRAAGLDTAALERQFLALEPSFSLPRGLDDLSAEAARTMLEDSASRSLMQGAR